MGIEIERKFLVIDNSWQTAGLTGKQYKQGYLIGSKTASVRIRIEGDKAFINIKSATLGIRRQEYEYPIPLEEANEILDTLCVPPLIEKTRYHITHEGFTWELDVFQGLNKGLVVAEIELTSEEQVFSKPAWVGEEVSDDPRYYNVNLVEHPFTAWT